jgi:hypothetical protein
MHNQPNFAITSQKLGLHSKAKADAESVAYMELLPPAYSPGPWEIVSWKYDPQASGKIHIVWRHA